MRGVLAHHGDAGGERAVHPPREKAVGVGRVERLGVAEARVPPFGGGAIEKGAHAVHVERDDVDPAHDGSPAPSD